MTVRTWESHSERVASRESCWEMKRSERRVGFSHFTCSLRLTTGTPRRRSLSDTRPSATHRTPPRLFSQLPAPSGPQPPQKIALERCNDISRGSRIAQGREGRAPREGGALLHRSRALFPASSSSPCQTLPSARFCFPPCRSPTRQAAAIIDGKAKQL
jgi:hypothetical protein